MARRQSGLPGIFLNATAPDFIAGQMNGVASMAAVGRTIAHVAARMDGIASMAAHGSLVYPRVGHMDGHASMAGSSIAVTKSSARMDGRAQMVAAGHETANGAAQMDGVANMIGAPVLGIGFAQMDGVGSFDVVRYVPPPITYVEVLRDTILSRQVRPAPLLTYHLVVQHNIRITPILKNVLRLKVTQQDHLSLSEKFVWKWVPKLKEAISVHLGASTHTEYHYTLTNPIYVQPTLATKWHAVLSLLQSVHVGGTTSDKFIWGRALTEALKVSDPLNARAFYKASLAQLLKIIELEGLKLRHPVTLSQQINLSQLLIGGIGVKLLQKILAAGTALPAFHYHLTLDSRVKLRDALEHLVSEILTELFTVHDTLGRQFIASSSLAQLLTVHPALNNKLVLKLVGNIQVSPEQLVSMIYAGDPLLDGVAITALYISPSGTTTAWAVNTRTAAVTEYLNYDFNSFAVLGDRYVAAGPDGLYELDGDTDDGALIIADLMGGYLQLNEKKMFGIKGAYVAIRGGGRFYLKLVAGDGREYVYELKAQPNLMTTKVKVGKGISTTYMAWELITEGQDFDLDSIEFIPMTRGRRV